MFSPIKNLHVKTFITAPDDHSAVFGATYYCVCGTSRLFNIYNVASESDAPRIAYLRYSDDNGRRWSEPTILKTVEQLGDSVRRTYYRGGYLDELSGRFITLYDQGVFSGNAFKPEEAVQSLQLHYTVSRDGNQTCIHQAPVIQNAPGFDTEHPLPGVWKGRNSVMLGDLGCRPITLGNGDILVPCQISPVDENGRYINQGHGYTYHNSAVLIGRWRDEATVNWHLSALVEADCQRTTRGLLEPTIATLNDQSVIMVMRGSNERYDPGPPETTEILYELGGYRWYSRSTDGGRTWSTARPWTYDDGEPFFSPSSCSELLSLQDGRLLWFGNIVADPPQGNSPRYPMVVGKVDRNTGCLIRSSCQMIDNRRPGEASHLSLSNFYAREDRETGEIVLHMPRLGVGEALLLSDLYEYRFKFQE